MGVGGVTGDEVREGRWRIGQGSIGGGRWRRGSPGERVGGAIGQGSIGGGRWRHRRVG